MKTLTKFGAVGAALTCAGILTGCAGNNAPEGGATTETGGEMTPANTELKGEIRADGSSTVYPITAAVAEEFRKTHPNVRVSVAQSGTGGGFKKFAAGETILQDASRPIKDNEADAAKKKGIEYIELPVAYDGLSVVVAKQNTMVDCLTTAELKKVWDSGSKVQNWSQIRPALKSRPLKLYGPGTDSGTFDYFTDEINGDEGKSRSDYTASEDDNVLVQGVSRDPGALGYFGYAYYEENADKLKVLGVDAGDGCVVPSAETISGGKYAPLSRPLFLYVDKKAAQRPEVQEFVKFYLTNAPKLVRTVGYVPLPDSVYQAALARFEAGTTGTVYGKDAKGKSLGELFGGAMGAQDSKMKGAENSAMEAPAAP